MRGICRLILFCLLICFAGVKWISCFYCCLVRWWFFLSNWDFLRDLVKPCMLYLCLNYFLKFNRIMKNGIFSLVLFDDLKKVHFILSVCYFCIVALGMSCWLSWYISRYWVTYVLYSCHGLYRHWYKKW